ncbi:MAG TPA: hypothetical protein DDY91_10260 [Planctomycetaceae bacterium]|nr:hypothetical protein [Planctomycetaceae bacterium]
MIHVPQRPFRNPVPGKNRNQKPNSVWTRPPSSAKNEGLTEKFFREVPRVQIRVSPGDWIVYCKTKFSQHPGERARNVEPATKGDEYCYTVDKYWVVESVSPTGQICLRTPGGKQHIVAADDPHLRRPSLWERIWYRSRFLSARENATARNSDSMAVAGH